MILTFDTETAGLHGPLHRVAWLSDDGDRGWLKASDDLSPLVKRFEVADILVGHNVSYDVRVLEKVGVMTPWEKVHDTMQMASFLVGNEEKSLLALSMRYLDYDGAKDVAVHGYSAENFALIPDSILRPYTEQQLLNTLCLFVMWRKHLPEEAYEVDRRLLEVLYRMRARGVLIDVEKLATLREEIAGKKEETEERLKRVVVEKGEVLSQQSLFSDGGKVLSSANFGSPKQMAAILEGYGFDFPRTPTGQMSTAAENLEPHSDHEFVGPLLEWRRYDKLLSTYLDGYSAMVGEDNAIHTSYSTAITRTGRLNSSEPNLQNVDPFVKSVFIPRPGYVVWDPDYRQIEFRLAVYLSGDSAGIEEFASGLDPHTATALHVLNDMTARAAAKTVNFGIIYGMGPDELARWLRISRGKAESTLYRFFAHYSGIATKRRKLLGFAKRNGVVQLPNGRTLYLDPEEYYKAFNYLIQHEAAWVCKKAMLAVNDILSGEDAHLILQVHDELAIEVAEDVADRLRGPVAEAMREASAFPMEIDFAEWQDSWANKVETAPF